MAKIKELIQLFNGAYIPLTNYNSYLIRVKTNKNRITRPSIPRPTGVERQRL